MVKNTYIYALYDPRDWDHVRYVGKTTDVDKRVVTHLFYAKKNKSGHIYNWIRKLLQDGIKPEVNILETVVDGNWQEAEKSWIALCRYAKFDLTNATDGGDGVNPGPSGRTLTEEHKAKIAKSNKQYASSEDERKNRSERLKKYWERVKIGEIKAPNSYFVFHKISRESIEKMRQTKLNKKLNNEQ